MTDDRDEVHERTSGEEPSLESNDASLREGIDYYIENGLMVFTAHFLRRRGYCCESGCRHCPYGESNV
jgi:hypothetical protein